MYEIHAICNLTDIARNQFQCVEPPHQTFRDSCIACFRRFAGVPFLKSACELLLLLPLQVGTRWPPFKPSWWVFEGQAALVLPLLNGTCVPLAAEGLQCCPSWHSCPVTRLEGHADSFNNILAPRHACGTEAPCRQQVMRVMSCQVRYPEELLRNAGRSAAPKKAAPETGLQAIN